MREQLHGWYRKPVIVLGVCIGLIGVVWAAYFVWQVGYSIVLIRRGQNPTRMAAQRAFQASLARNRANTHVTTSDLARLEAEDEPTLGNPKARVHIVEFVDYQCPFCRQVAPMVREFMKTHTEDAYFILRDFPILDLHPEAERVAVAARCVFDQKELHRFWLFHDRLFASQESQHAEDLRLIAQHVGADLATYDACVGAQRPISHIRASFQDGVAAGVGGTPTFFFNGVKVQGAMDANMFEAIFQEVRQRAP